MPSTFHQHVPAWLAGMMSLCLVSGCAVDGRQSGQSSEAELARLPAPSVIQLSQPAIASDIRTVSDVPGKPSAVGVVPTAWAPPESRPNPPPMAGEHHSISEAIPPPRQPSLRRTLSLREAIDTALVQNPDVVTARAAGPVALAARGVAATYPWNPTVQVGVFPYARDETGNLLAVKNQVAVTQTLELAHQTQHRRQAADAAWNAERAKIAQTEWAAVTTAMRAYFDVLYKKELLDLARESAKLGDDMAGAVRRRFEAGIATPAERITANVAARRSRRRAELAEADYQTSLQTLRVALNIAAQEPIAPTGALEAYRWLPVVDVLGGSGGAGDTIAATDDDAILQITANRPDVATARYAASAAEANLDLARANRIPNVTTGPSYERDESGTVFVGLTAQLDLPIWNSGCPLVRQRNAEAQQQLITWRQTQTRAAVEARAAVARYERVRGLWRGLPESSSTGNEELKSIHDAFENGQASIIEVLATQDNLIQERQAYLDLLNQVSQASVDVIAALAIDPGRLVESPSGAAPDVAKHE